MKDVVLFDPLEWLAGFYEGDGTFSYRIQLNGKAPKGFRQTAFKLIQKTPQILEYAKSVVGFCNIHPVRTWWNLQVDGVVRVKHILDLLRGRIRSPQRVMQFNRIAKFAGVKGTTICRDVTWSWLGGFFDAEGYTSRRVHNNPRFGRYEYFMLGISQKEKYILKKIQKKVGGRIYIVNGVDVYTLALSKEADAIQTAHKLSPYCRNKQKLHKMMEDMK